MMMKYKKGTNSLYGMVLVQDLKKNSENSLFVDDFPH